MSSKTERQWEMLRDAYNGDPTALALIAIFVVFAILIIGFEILKRKTE